jgi:hypothetical protein
LEKESPSGHVLKTNWKRKSGRAQKIVRPISCPTLVYPANDVSFANPECHHVTLMFRATLPNESSTSSRDTRIDCKVTTCERKFMLQKKEILGVPKFFLDSRCEQQAAPGKTHTH